MGYRSLLGVEVSVATQINRSVGAVVFSPEDRMNATCRQDKGKP